jgi:predicted site-specific integrase-resolvase
MTAQKKIAPAQQREPITIFTLDEWCKMRKVSKATARRLIAAGKVKITHLSERRIAIRSDHDQEYLDSRLRDFA